MEPLGDAEIVVIGGGAIGCAVAYSLAQAGKTDVLLVDREDALASVTTAQAAGLVGQLRSSIDRVRLAMASVATFSELERDPEARPGWRQVGSLRIAETPERAEEFSRLQRTAAAAGLAAEMIDAAEAERRWPGMRLGAVTAILWCPTDGYLQPYDLAMAYRHQARRRGVRFAVATQVEAITVANGRVAAVATNRGRVRCATVINAAGAHAYHLARLVGLELPIVPVRHQYLVTVPVAGIGPQRPCFRVPDATLYGRAEMTALLLGGWEAPARSVDPRDYPLAGAPPPIVEDWPVLAGFAARLAPLYPAVAEAGVRHVFRGWPTFTPDGRFIVGESRRIKGFVMAGGCNAHGVSGSAGIGGHVVEALVDPNPSPYVKSLSPDRFTETSWDWPTARRQAQAVYESYYVIGR
jgi:glycine/D-amino acid oxidase-like deaminating enzyme